MDYAALRAEIALPAYSGKTDAEIVAALAAPISCDVDVPALDVRRTLLESQSMAQAGTNPWMKIRGFHAAGFAAAVASSAATAAVWVLCDELVEEVRREGTFGMSRSAMYAVMSASLTALESAQLLGQGDKAAVLALAAGTTTRAAQLGLEPVSLGHIQTARVA